MTCSKSLSCWLVFGNFLSRDIKKWRSDVQVPSIYYFTHKIALDSKYSHSISGLHSWCTIYILLALFIFLLLHRLQFIQEMNDNFVLARQCPSKWGWYLIYLPTTKFMQLFQEKRLHLLKNSEHTRQELFSIHFILALMRVFLSFHSYTI